MVKRDREKEGLGYPGRRERDSPEAGALNGAAASRKPGTTCTGGIESCFRRDHPEYIEITEKMM